MLKRLVKKAIAHLGYQVVNVRNSYTQDGLSTSHNDHFRGDARFRAAYSRGIEASLGIDPRFEWRVHVALWAAATALRVRGDFVECGVNAGFISSAIMRYLDWNAVGRQFYLVDTFSGPVMAQYSREEVDKGRAKIAEEALAAGAYVTDENRVRSNYSEWKNVSIVEGVIPEVLGTVAFADIAFLHIDRIVLIRNEPVSSSSGRGYRLGPSSCSMTTRSSATIARREK